MDFLSSFYTTVFKIPQVDEMIFKIIQYAVFKFQCTKLIRKVYLEVWGEISLKSEDCHSTPLWLSAICSLELRQPFKTVFFKTTISLTCESLFCLSFPYPDTQYFSIGLVAFIFTLDFNTHKICREGRSWGSSMTQ